MSVKIRARSAGSEPSSSERGASRLVVGWLALGLVVTACSGHDGESGAASASSKPTSTETTSAKPAQSAPTPTIEAPVQPAGVIARVKAEVDKRSDGLAGTVVPVTGARAALQSPKEWTTTKGPTTLVTSTDKKAQLAASSYGTEGADKKLAEVLGAAGLTACTWGPAEPVSAGKHDLPGQVADGLCTQGGAQVKTAWLASEGLLAVVSWADGGDDRSLFASLRSIVRAGGTDGVAACCDDIRRNMKSAPPQQQPIYAAAAQTCDNLRSNPQGRALLGQVRSLLSSVNVPSTCR
jgi:hypothetical protein